MPRSNLYKKIERYGLTREAHVTRAAEGLGSRDGRHRPGDGPTGQRAGSRVRRRRAHRRGPSPSARRCARRSVALTWFWVALARGAAVALPLWPYERGCGLQLVFYLGAAGVTAVVALLGALASWSHRRGFAHVVCRCSCSSGRAAVALREVLPRVGYARTA